MNNQSILIHRKIRKNQIKPIEISTKQRLNEDIFDIIKDKNIEPNQNKFFRKNNTFNKTFTGNIIKPNYNNKKNLNLNLQNINNGVNVNIILSVTKRAKKTISKDKEEKNIPKISPYTFKYFCNTANKNKFIRSLSTNTTIKKTNQNLESNFMKLTKDANIYTTNAEYIQNKKLLLFNKYNFEDNKYKPNRANLFDMTSIPHSKSKNNTLYKTTYFRGGRMFFSTTKQTQQ